MIRKTFLLLILVIFIVSLSSCHKKRPCPAYNSQFEPDTSPTKYNKKGLVKQNRRHRR